MKLPFSFVWFFPKRSPRKRVPPTSALPMASTSFALAADNSQDCRLNASRRLWDAPTSAMPKASASFALAADNSLDCPLYASRRRHSPKYRSLIMPRLFGRNKTEAPPSSRTTLNSRWTHAVVALRLQFRLRMSVKQSVDCLKLATRQKLLERDG